MKKNYLRAFILAIVAAVFLSSCNNNEGGANHSPADTLIYHLFEFNSEEAPFSSDLVLQIYFSAGDIGESATKEDIALFASHFGLSAEEMEKSPLYKDGKFSSPSELVASSFTALLTEEISSTSIDGKEHSVYNILATLGDDIKYNVVYELVYTGALDGEYTLISGEIIEYHISSEK